MDQRIKDRKRLRGYILKSLSILYPSPALVESVQSSVMATQISESVDIKPFLDYLEDRGYIVIRNSKADFGARLTHVKLTSKGVDLLEGTISDPGVILDGGS